MSVVTAPLRLNAYHETKTAPSAPSTQHRRDRVTLTAVIVGFAAAALSFAGSWIPSPWGDEAASIMSAQRSWPSLFHMLGHVDAVHGTYYAFLHVWIDFFGPSIVSVRLPSAIAVGVAASGIVMLGTRMRSLRLGVLAGVLFALLPRVTYMGAEARPYMIGTALVVWLTFVFVRQTSRRSRRVGPWVLYAVLLTLSTYVFLYSALMAVVFAIVLIAGTRDMRLFLCWSMWTIIALIACSPLAFAAVSQRGQIEFLSHANAITASRFFVLQWFSNWRVAIVAWAIILALFISRGIGLWLSTRRAKTERMRVLSTHPSGAHGISLFSLCLAWFAVPPVILLLANALIMPLYQIRYTTFVTPAIALLIAIALERLTRRRWMSLVAIACAAALVAPVFVHQRGPYAKDYGSDWAQVAGLISTRSQPGDAIVFDESIRHSRRPRLAMHLYPDQFANVEDVRLARDYALTAGLRDQTRSIADSADRIRRTDGRLWLIEVRGQSSVGRHIRLNHLAELGYRVQSSTELNRDTVYLLTTNDKELGST